MKKTYLVVAGILLATLVSPNVNAALVVSNDAASAVSAPASDSAIANRLTARVNEIKAMDKTVLNHSEKRVLRKELRSLKSQLKDIGGRGVYLSVGAIIIIILLLILIL